MPPELLELLERLRARRSSTAVRTDPPSKAQLIEALESVTSLLGLSPQSERPEGGVRGGVPATLTPEQRAIEKQMERSRVKTLKSFGVGPEGTGVGGALLGGAKRGVRNIILGPMSRYVIRETPPSPSITSATILGAVEATPSVVRAVLRAVSGIAFTAASAVPHPSTAALPAPPNTAPATTPCCPRLVASSSDSPSSTERPCSSAPNFVASLTAAVAILPIPVVARGALRAISLDAPGAIAISVPNSARIEDSWAGR